MKQVKPCPFECNANDCKDCGAYTYSHHTQTNEEWIHTLNTEQLAEFLTKVILDDKRFRMTMVGGVNETKLWLKQPHTTIKE